MLMPTLRSAREQARLVVCASNQHQLHIGVLSYRTDNLALPETGYKLVTAASQPDLSGRCPMGISTIKDDPNFTRFFNIWTLEPYLGGHDQENRTLTGVWVCPSNPRGPILRHSDFFGGGVGEYNYPYLRYVGGWYAFFTHADRWATGIANHPEELVAGDLGGSDRLFLADNLYFSKYWGENWTYNHGLEGPAEMVTAVGLTDFSVSPRLTGENQTFGDGHTRWVANQGEITSWLDPEAGRIKNHPDEYTYYLRRRYID
jgi:hypothetical protein